MSIFSDLGKDIQGSWAGDFWDTHIGREGLIGAVGDITGLWQSGTAADEGRRAKARLKELYGGAIDRSEDYLGKIEDYYQGPGGLLGRTRQGQALKNVQVASEAQKLSDTSYTKGDMANIEQMERPDYMGNIYASAELGMSNSMLGQKLAMNKQTFEMEDKIAQLEMNLEDSLNSIA